MTLNELLALLGRAWPRLLLFPGGLTAFAIVWLAGSLQRRDRRPERQKPFDAGRSWLLVLGAIVPPWLGLALLPLPPAPELSRQTDMIVTLALLECPLLTAIARGMRSGDPGVRAGGARRLAAALNSYPPLVLASLALTQAAGSFEIAALARRPGDLAPPFAGPLHWIGAVAWVLALPPALGLGPFSGGPEPWKGSANSAHAGAHTSTAFPYIRSIRGCLTGTLGDDPMQVGLRLRALGLIVLAALPWMAAFGALDEGGLRTLGGLAAWLLAPPLLAALLWGYDWLTSQHAARRWARAYLALDAALLLALLWAALVALRARLA